MMAPVAREAHASSWATRRRLRRPSAGVLAGAFFVALIFTMYAPSLVGGKVLSAGDHIFFQPPFLSERPAGLTRPSNKDLVDPVEVFHPDLWRTRESLADGGFGLWNPNVGAGRPLLASQQFSPLFPTHLLAFLLPFWKSLVWIAALKIMIAAVGVYLLCRRAFDLDAGPAALGAIAFALSAYMIIWLEHPLTNAWALLPWAFLLTDRLLRVSDPRPSVLALGALFGVLLLAGHPEAELTVFVATGAYLAFRFAEGRGTGRLDRRALVGRAGWWVLAVVAGLLLSAVMTIPVLELFAHGARDPRGGPAPPFGILASWTFPEWWGRPDLDLYRGGPFSVYAEKTAYFGALPTLLALAGLASRPSRVQLFFVGLAGVSLAILLPTPVNDLVRSLPGGDLMALTRLLVLACFSGAMLAAFGLQRLLDATPPVRRRMLVVMCVSAIVPLGLLLAHLGLLSEWRGAIRQLPTIHEHEKSYDVVRLGSMWRWALLAVGGVLLLALLFRFAPNARTVVTVVVLGITAFDLVTLNRGYHPQVAQARADPAAPPQLRQLRAQAGSARVMGAGIVFMPNLASRYGLRDPREHDHPESERFERLFSGLGGGEPDRWRVDPYSPARDRIADLFAVRFILMPDGTVMRNPDAVPRAWVAYSWFPAPSTDHALLYTVKAPVSQARDAPAIEGAPASADGTQPPAAEPASVVTDRDDRVDVRVRAQRPGYLILDDSFYPGWKATVDGREARILPANVNFRAVAVPTGGHLVSFRYRPASAEAGAAISGGTALVMVAAAGFIVLRRRRAERPD